MNADSRDILDGALALGANADVLETELLPVVLRYRLGWWFLVQSGSEPARPRCHHLPS